LKARFARSQVGYLWFILQPLAQALIFALFLSELIGVRLPQSTSKLAFPIYLMAGMAAWGLFSELLNRSISIFIEYGNSMKKIAFPRIALPLIALGSALINHFFLLLATLTILLFLGHVPGAALFALPIGIVLITALALGIGITLGILNVFSRDVAQVMIVIMQLWFWATPIVYPREVVPTYVQGLIAANPLTWLVKIYQDALLTNTWPAPSNLLAPALLAMLVLTAALLLFRRASSEIVDVL
jgi:lipopolysaccharide transport system permease protein